MSFEKKTTNKQSFQDKFKKELLLHKYAYYSRCNPLISDFQYDKLEKRYKRLYFKDCEETDLPLEVTEINCPEDIKQEYFARLKQLNKTEVL